MRVRRGTWRQTGEAGPARETPEEKSLKAKPELGGKGATLLSTLTLSLPSLSLLECVSSFIVPKNSPSLLEVGVRNLLGRVHLRHAPASELPSTLFLPGQGPVLC